MRGPFLTLYLLVSIATSCLAQGSSLYKGKFEVQWKLLGGKVDFAYVTKYEALVDLDGSSLFPEATAQVVSAKDGTQTILLLIREYETSWKGVAHVTDVDVEAAILDPSTKQWQTLAVPPKPVPNWANSKSHMWRWKSEADPIFWLTGEVKKEYWDNNQFRTDNLLLGSQGYAVGTKTLTNYSAGKVTRDLFSGPDK